MDVFISTQNGRDCGKWLRNAFRNPKIVDQLDRPSSVVSKDWSQFIDCIYRHLRQLKTEQDLKALFDDFNLAYAYIFTKNSTFIPLFDSVWQKFILKELTIHLMNVALKADENRIKAGLTRHDMTHFYLMKAKSRIDTLLNKIMNDRFGNPQAKSGVYILVNASLKALFILNELGLGPKLLEQMESFTEKNEYSKSASENVTFNYYAGKLRLFNHDFALADKHLTIAFNNCLDSAHQNKHLILKHLLVVRLVRGCLPSPTLLLKYNLSSQFGPLVNCLKVGYYRGYMNHLETVKEWLMAFDCFSIMRFRVELQFFRRITCKYASMTDSNILHYSTLLKAFRIAGFTDWQIAGEVDVEATLVCLIDEGLLKGYLIHGKKIAVLAKSGAFPSPYQVFSARFGSVY